MPVSMSPVKIKARTIRGRIFVTHNRRHFRKIHNRLVLEGKHHPGIILLRRAEPEFLLDRIKTFLSELDQGTKDFCVTV